ncbi:MAG: hypothetical protein O3A25_12790 [Acidobacteria bacterium]|nr:hypothetical protein [Acidobacteriota bacterium]
MTHMGIRDRIVGTALSLVAALTLGLPAVSNAQDSVVRVSTLTDDAAPDEPSVALNLSRIRYQLARVQATEASISGLRFEYQLSVFGVAPPIEILRGFDTRYGGIPFGSPTHADFENLWVPREFRAPTVPLMPLIRWTFGR